MNRLLWITSLAFFLAGSTGCLHHNTRCNSGNCSTGGCSTCSSGNCGNSGGGILGKLAGDSACSTCGGHGSRKGCVPGPLAWQQGGHNYSGHLSQNIGQNLLPAHCAAKQIQSQPVNPGPATGTVAYPYYMHHGPRDFLLDNPPTLGR